MGLPTSLGALALAAVGLQLLLLLAGDAAAAKSPVLQGRGTGWGFGNVDELRALSALGWWYNCAHPRFPSRAPRGRAEPCHAMLPRAAAGHT